METPRYRIGNDLTVLWAICNRDGSPYKLDDKVVRLFVVNQLGRTEIKPIIQSLPDGITNNVIRWDSKGGEQTVLGLYSLAIEIENKDDSKVIHKDYCDAFELVGSSCDECVEEGEANIQDGGDLILTSRLDVYRFGIPKISIGTNGNWFIDGVDSGQSALAGGPGLVNKIYNEKDFGKEFEEGSVIDTFNAQAINKLYRILNSLTLGQSIKDLDIISAKHNDVISYDGSEWRNVPFNDLLGKYASQGNGSVDQAMSDTSTNAVQNKVIKKYIDAVSTRLKVLEGWFKEYDETTIYTEKNFFSKKAIASGGVGGDGGGNTPGGTGNLISMERWDEYDPALPQVLGAILGIDLYERLENSSIELIKISEEVKDHEGRIQDLETSGGGSSPELSYDSIVDALDYVPFNEDSFTQENIQQTLGIQDWALADNPPANASSADKLSDSKAYTIWGRNFFQNGKPVNVTSSPIFSRNGGFYAYNYKDVSTMLMWYMSDNTHSEFILGHKSSEALERTRICGYPICFHIGKYVDSNGVPRTPAMTIDENGDVIIEGNLTVKGTAGVGGKAIESQAVIVGPLALNSSISTGTKTQSQMNVIGFTTDAIAHMEDGLYTKVVYNGNVWEYSVKVTSSTNKVIFLRNDAGTSYTMTYNGSYWVIS